MSYHCMPRWYNHLYLLNIENYMLNIENTKDSGRSEAEKNELHLWMYAKKMAKDQVSTIIFAIENYLVYGATYCISFPNNSFLFLTEAGGVEGGSVRSDSPGPALQSPPLVDAEQPPDPELEKRLLGYLSELSLSLPIDSLAITNQLNTVSALNMLVYTTSQKCGHTYYYSLCFRKIVKLPKLWSIWMR